jgi:hypothetical protein
MYQIKNERAILFEYIVTFKAIARQRPHNTHGQQYSSSVFFVSVQLAHEH